jgi:hypothetical protein
VNLGHRRDRARLEHAAAVREVRLQQRRRAELEHLAKRPLREQALSGRHRDGGRPRDAGQRLGVLRQGRLLEEPHVERLERPGELDRHRRREPTVSVPRELDILPHGLSDRGDSFRRPPDEPVRLHRPHRLVDRRLHRREALLDERARALRRLLG